IKTVHFLGVEDNVQPILAASDYFLLPSLHENHSIALLEAMAMELPVVATDVGGNKETVKDGKFGIIIPPYDASALAEAIIQMKDNQCRNAFKEQIKAYSFSEFGNESVDAQLDAAYQATMHRS
ncbi:MAG: glycosyltransferase, partial [Lachnospiraceae bacterium]|nr:glycosyltransferase [Lachnospiraceae bacterium]